MKRTIVQNKLSYHSPNSIHSNVSEVILQPSDQQQQENNSISNSEKLETDKYQSQNFEEIIQWFQERHIYRGDPLSIIQKYQDKQRNSIKSDQQPKNLKMESSKLLMRRKTTVGTNFLSLKIN